MGLSPGELVFVRGQGTAKIVTSGKRLSVLSLSSPLPEQHARTLQTFHDDWGAFPIAFDRSSVELVVRAPPTDPAAIRRATKAHLAYCDELGVETKRRLEEHAASRYWSFWWD